jgi:ADP-heptose:LPS heptosyltransferase
MRLRGDERILLVPVNGIGDHLMFLPLAYRLKRHAPGIRVDMLSNAANGAARLMRWSHWLDAVVDYRLGSNDTAGYARYFCLEFPRLAPRLLRGRYDHVLSIVPNLFRRSILKLFPERRTLVEHDRRTNELEAAHGLLEAFEDLPRIHEHPSLLSFSELPSPLPRLRVEAGGYLVLGLSGKSPRRSYSRVAELVGALSAGTRHRLVLAGPGSGSDPPNGTVDIRGQTSVEEIAAIVGQAAACVAVDGGMLYMATAQNVPVVGLFGPVHSSFREPPGATESSFVALDAGTPARAYERADGPADSDAGVDAIDPGDVTAATLRLLDGS